MLSGKRFKLTRPTTGMQLIDGKATLVTIPPDGYIKVLSGPHGQEADKGLIYVLWEEHKIALFAVDVEARGMEMKDLSSGHKSYESATG